MARHIAYYRVIVLHREYDVIGKTRIQFACDAYREIFIIVKSKRPLLKIRVAERAFVKIRKTGFMQLVVQLFDFPSQNQVQIQRSVQISRSRYHQVHAAESR